MLNNFKQNNMDTSSKIKKIFCPIHGFIEIRPHILEIVDTYEFQRLRNLKQLGAAHYVFPSATHTRFSHSIAVGHLARKMIESIKKVQPYLDIKERMIELVEIGGLIHDLGHGPFSHLWDHYVISKEDKEHEERSCDILKDMISKYNLHISDDEYKIICQIINPSGEFKYHWYYQIVANKRCQLDVDKIDYIQRDSFYLGNVGLNGNFDRLITEARVVLTNDGHLELGWHHRLNYEIFSLFSTRFKLHKLVYTHHAVKSHEYLLLDALKRAYDKLKKNEIKFTDLTDCAVCDQNESNMMKNHMRMIRRDLPSLVGEAVVAKSNPKYHTTIKTTPFPIRIVNILIDKIDIGFSSGDGNPMDQVFYYKTDRTEKDAIEGYFMEPTWCKTEFHERILRCYDLIGKKTPDAEVNKTDAGAFWETYKKELNIK